MMLMNDEEYMRMALEERNVRRLWERSPSAPLLCTTLSTKQRVDPSQSLA